MKPQLLLLRSIRIWITIFMVFLILSGLTAFPLETELRWLVKQFESKDSTIYHWLYNTYYCY